MVAQVLTGLWQTLSIKLFFLLKRLINSSCMGTASVIHSWFLAIIFLVSWRYFCATKNLRWVPKWAILPARDHKAVRIVLRTRQWHSVRVTIIREKNSWSPLRVWNPNLIILTFSYLLGILSLWMRSKFICIALWLRTSSLLTTLPQVVINNLFLACHAQTVLQTLRCLDQITLLSLAVALRPPRSHSRCLRISHSSS